ncbi:MAG: exonuclease domain-containing protein [Cyclobacteriaceae bacterium]
MKLNLKLPLCFFDLETTGINITQDRIIEIAVIKLMPNGESIRKSNLINPTVPISPESSAIHGITNEDVKDKPTFKEVAKEYIKFFEGSDLAGFNILKFDMPMLVEEFLRAEIDFDYSRKKIIDAQRIFHMMEKRTLSAAFKFYCGSELEKAHSAEADTQATMDVLLAQVERYENQDVTDSLGKKIGTITNSAETLSQLTAADLVDLAGRMTKNDKGEAVFNFGKHKGKSVLKVFKDEPAYYDWMMNGDFALDTKRWLTKIKLSVLTGK